MIEIALLILVAALVVAVAVLAFTQARFFATAITGQSELYLAQFRAAQHEAQAERTLLYRVLISRGAAEFGTLDKIRNAGEKVASGDRSESREEYFARLEEDMRKMGLEPRDADMPLVPEGQ